MAPVTVGETSDLFDENGQWVGVLDLHGREQLGLSAAQVAAVAFAPIAAADIQTTEGAALGESREIADGDDAGARLIWRVPQGQTEPAWCWWTWPQAAYL